MVGKIAGLFYTRKEEAKQLKLTIDVSRRFFCDIKLKRAFSS